MLQSFRPVHGPRWRDRGKSAPLLISRGLGHSGRRWTGLNFRERDFSFYLHAIKQKWVVFDPRHIKIRFIKFRLSPGYCSPMNRVILGKGSLRRTDLCQFSTEIVEDARGTDPVEMVEGEFCVLGVGRKWLFWDKSCLITLTNGGKGSTSSRAC